MPLRSALEHAIWWNRECGHRMQHPLDFTHERTCAKSTHESPLVLRQPEKTLRACRRCPRRVLPATARNVYGGAALDRGGHKLPSEDIRGAHECGAKLLVV